MLNNAASMCPHHKLYVGNATFDKSYLLPSLFTSDTFDMFVLSGVALFEAGLAVLAINLEEYDAGEDESDALSAETDLSLNIPANIELLDLSEGLIGLLLNETGAYLGGTVEISDGGGSDLGINVLMRSSVLDEDGSLSLPLSNSSMSFDSESAVNELSVSEIRVFGLDSFNEFGSLSAIGAQTLQVDFVLEEVAIEMDIDLSVLVSDASISSRSSSTHEEHITARFGMRNLGIDASFLLAVDLSKFDGMELGPLLFSENILPCMLSTLYSGVNVTKLTLSLGNVDPFELKGFSSSGVDDAIASATTALFAEYGDEISAALPVLMDIIGRSTINELMSQDSDGSESNTSFCPDVPESSKDGFVDFRDIFLNATSALKAGGSGDMPYGDMMVLAKRFVDDELVAADPETGLPRVNRYEIDMFEVVWSLLFTFPADIVILFLLNSLICIFDIMILCLYLQPFDWSIDIGAVGG